MIPADLLAERQRVLEILERLQAAHHHYAYCDSSEAGEADDAIDAIEMELGELLIPRDGQPPFDLRVALASAPEKRHE